MRTSEPNLTPAHDERTSRTARGTTEWYTPDNPEADELVRHIRGLSKAILEVLLGVRPIHSLTRWLSPSVYTKLEDRAALAREQYRGQQRRLTRPAVFVSIPRVQTDHHSCVDAAVVISMRNRVRAMTLTLEPHPRTGNWVLVEVGLL
ncbi:MAG: Rv3235 family protein [Microbacteriaceae bacterium]|nr:Rv3235 family protein [Microbacteriaceae bacterium]MCI1206967.1 Rv3235 family protein [Microbacteriaceae bacterium]